MPSIQVRDLPEHIYHALKVAAKHARRSLSQQAIISLAKGLDIPVAYQKRREIVLSEIEKNESRLKGLSQLDITVFIREDRDR
ncbi:MAG: hypothetical protein R3B93_22035 [Bacteroidia bacterium]